MSSRTRAVLLLALALCVASPLTGHAAPGPEMHDVWVGRLVSARQAVEKARESLRTNRSSYARMRHNNSRGEKREQLVEEHGKAQEALVNAEAELEALLGEARRAGVPPGWIREAMEGYRESPPARAE